MKKVRIYGTLGPACADGDILWQMLREGMDGIRLNLSHTTLAEASDLIDIYHRAAAACGVSPELLIDMQGPEMRIGALPDPICLASGDLILMEEIPFPETVQTALKTLPDQQEILLDDGKILLKKADSFTDASGKLQVIRGGRLESRKSVFLPGLKIRPPALTDQDRDQLSQAKKFGLTAVMQPFVRDKNDLLELHQALDRSGCGDLRLLAKIENREGMEQLSELIPYCDEIVIARGDLGNSMMLWELPAVQKQIARTCREAGRDFMVVTQMLDSMTHSPVPTRAELSDVFNAVLDGAASVMVTGETATGEYPVSVIKYLCKTVLQAEQYLCQRN